MKYRKLLTSAILTTAICLISVFVLVETAGAWDWFGWSSLCFDGEIKAPSGDVVCSVTLEEVTVITACDNINSNEASPECHQGEAHVANLVQTIYPTGGGTKEQKLATVEGCYDFSKFDTHGVEGHVHTCPTESVNMWELPGSAYVQQFVALWVCTSTTNNNIIGVGRDTCTWTGNVDPETCIPEHDVQFACDEEVFGKKWTWE